MTKFMKSIFFTAIMILTMAGVRAQNAAPDLSSEKMAQREGDKEQREKEIKLIKDNVALKEQKS